MAPRRFPPAAQRDSAAKRKKFARSLELGAFTLRRTPNGENDEGVTLHGIIDVVLGLLQRDPSATPG
jgi:hypothetical protein